MKNKTVIEKKGFAVLMLAFGVLGLLLMTHHIASYEAILRPRMDFLIENKIITNDISGITFLRMFTNESNILVDVYLILFAIGIFGAEPLYKFTHNEWLRGAVTLNIAVTGIIYFTVLLPFSQSFPMEKGIWFSNVINIWNHLITPVFFTALWFFPVVDKVIPKVKYALLDLIYPICYFIMCIILGAKDGFYPYPFLNGQQMWAMLFKDKPYDSTIGVLLLVAAVVILSGVFFGVACGLGGIHNKRLKKAEKKETVKSK
ncbi:MAG: Pr6Pr family membrane protein [Clostridia bacterium]|nr:Pr6Pr family membrane protein [Clostridia bacterium]